VPPGTYDVRGGAYEGGRGVLQVREILGSRATRRPGGRLH
jgi:hypothetical protein